MRWQSRSGIPGGLLRKDASARTRDKEGIVFVRTGREAGVLIIAELFSEVVTVSQPVPGEQETDITDGIRLSDWYYKYKKSSESNGKRQRSTVLTLIYW
ncbi:hypothetical protein ECZU47_30820 [Escherichia coli]|nr:hypothetical protein ECZU42_00480 [Escherichia coli]GHM39660.1 hypothetical protein ECZU47_30820 [Escherichia coli]